MTNGKKATAEEILAHVEKKKAARSWKAGVKTAGDADWCYNALRFATEDEAKAYASDLYSRWTAVKETKATRCADPVNSIWKDGALLSVDPAKADAVARVDAEQAGEVREAHEPYGAGDDWKIDGVGFQEPGGRSALRRATRGNPRRFPCPTCGAPNRLTPADVRAGYQCNGCADRDEGVGFGGGYSEGEVGEPEPVYGSGPSGGTKDRRKADGQAYECLSAFINDDPRTANHSPYIVGLVRVGERGYFPQIQFGCFQTMDAARARADDLNQQLYGLTPKQAIGIVLRDMAGAQIHEAEPEFDRLDAEDREREAEEEWTPPAHWPKNALGTKGDAYCKNARRGCNAIPDKDGALCRECKDMAGYDNDPDGDFCGGAGR